MCSSQETAVFAYGSLVDPASAAATLGRGVGEPLVVTLGGWRRRFSQARDNESCEKTFARSGDGWVPPFVLGLNLERSSGSGADEGPRDPTPNGVLVAVDEGDLARLDRREIRYLRTDVTADVTYASEAPRFARVLTYVARLENLAITPPSGAVILRRYADTVEDAFATLGADQLDHYRRSTLPYPAEVIDGDLVGDRIPEGNPRDW